MLKYYRVIHGEHWHREEITKEKALHILLGTYKDCDMTHDMLTIPNHISTTYSDIDVESTDEQGRVECLMVGLWNMLPMDAEYDEDGNRINK